MTIHGNTFVNPFTSKLIGTLVRHGLSALGGLLTAQAWVDEASWTNLVEAATPVIVALALSAYEKYTSRQKLVTATAIAGTTEHQVERTITLGAAPPVTSPKDVVPIVAGTEYPVSPPNRGTLP